jgi:hypothetical protein
MCPLMITNWSLTLEMDCPLQPKTQQCFSAKKGTKACSRNVKKSSTSSSQLSTSSKKIMVKNRLHWPFELDLIPQLLQRVHCLLFERILVLRDERPDILIVEERGMLIKVFLPMELLLESFDSLFNHNNKNNMLPGICTSNITVYYKSSLSHLKASWSALLTTNTILVVLWLDGASSLKDW